MNILHKIQKNSLFVIWLYPYSLLSITPYNLYCTSLYCTLQVIIKIFPLPGREEDVETGGGLRPPDLVLDAALEVRVVVGPSDLLTKETRVLSILTNEVRVLALALITLLTKRSPAYLDD